MANQLSNYQVIGARLHFVTGRLAEHSLQDTLRHLSEELGFLYTIDVLGITVAALMTPEWIAKNIQVPDGTDMVVVPGYCEGSLRCIEQVAKCEVVAGPRDLRRLSVFFRQEPEDVIRYGHHDIQIIAEINHAPRLAIETVIKEAERLRAAGADVIDIGCDPGHTWGDVGVVVRELSDRSIPVSIDSMNPEEVAAAVAAGAELVLSVDSSNRENAADWGAEVVVIPDISSGPDSLDETIDYLAQRDVPLRIDPVLSPIGFGFAESLVRYMAVRKKYVDAEMMMGIGNLTELTDVDSAGINAILLGFCQEAGIRSILTTQVISWAQTSVRECDLARRLVHHAVENAVLPKHVETDLVVLRDIDRTKFEPGFFQRLSDSIRDHNLRVFVDEEGVHLVTKGTHITGDDPFAIFQQYLDGEGSRMDVPHAFYMGYEMCKAITALTLGKNYQQDEALDWGYLTVSEDIHSRIKDRKNGP